MHRETRYRELLSGRDRALARSPSAETNPADDDVSVEVGRGRVEDAGSAGEALSDAAGNSPASYRTEDEVSVSGEQQEVVEEEFVSVDEVQQVGLSPIAEVTEHSGGLRAEGQGFGPITSSSGSYGLASNLRASSLGLADQEEERSKYADLDQSVSVSRSSASQKKSDTLLDDVRRRVRRAAVLRQLWLVQRPALGRKVAARVDALSRGELGRGATFGRDHDWQHRNG